MTERSADVMDRFMDGLRALLFQYGADLSAEDHYKGYPECGEDIRMTVSIPAIYDSDGNTVREGCEIDLGKWQDGKREA